MVGLSKSRVAAYEQCPRRLWLEVHRRDLAAIDEGAQARFAAGNEVGAEAYRQRPGGVMISAENGLQAAIDATRDAIVAGPERPIFEATFTYEGVLVRADVLEPVAGRGWRIIEVKSSGGVKDYHLGDLATQTWVLEGNGVDLADAQIAHVDTGFRLTALDDYGGLFRHVSVFDQIRPIMAERSALVAEAVKVLAGAEPDIAPGAHCTAPFACAFSSHCGKDLPEGPEWPVTVLPGGAGEKWLEQGIGDLFDLPRNKLTSAVHQRVFDATVTGVPYHDLDAARTIIDAWEYPRTWLDFETIAFVLPKWLGTGPYEAVPFQFSAQIEQIDGDYDEVAFLDLSGEDPRRACAEALLKLPSVGSVVAYNAGFERNCIKGLAAACPDLADDLMALADRLVDLLPVTRSTWYHRDQRGSWSIKAVLPTIAPELDYGLLDVGNGMEAQAAYLNATTPGCSWNRKVQIDAALRTYCARDTEAMIVLARHLVGGEQSSVSSEEFGGMSFLTADGTELQLVRGQWYGMTMWPGYGVAAYHSPIKITGCQQGRGTIKLDFYNAAYAAGVRDFSYRLSPLAHRPDYLIAAIADQPERTVAIVELSPAWLESHMRVQFDKLKRLADSTGLSPNEAMGLLASEWGGPKEDQQPPPSEPAQFAVDQRRGEFMSGGRDEAPATSSRSSAKTS